jgi:hypothetical protein
MFPARDRLLFKIAHITIFLKSGPRPGGNARAAGRSTDSELLRTDFAANPCQRCEMNKKGKTPITPARTTVASVRKEMQSRDWRSQSAMMANASVSGRQNNRLLVRRECAFLIVTWANHKRQCCNPGPWTTHRAADSLRRVGREMTKPVPPCNAER